MFWFDKKIDTDLLRLAQITYGGEFYYGLNKYKQKELSLEGTKFQRVSDNLLKKIGNTKFYAYKNEDSGFSANLFENIRNGNIVIAFRGTERIGLGENTADFAALWKDVLTDINMISGKYDEQFGDAYAFFNVVKAQNPKAKITIIGQSLGGALAQITAAKIYSVTKQKTETYSYNAPGCKHLLEVMGCDTSSDYSFITNYAVMNDWCGMFGEHIGETYLLPPIPLGATADNTPVDIINAMLFVCHEGIFECSGKVIKKPAGFGQKEGLSLWYFDRNNPLKNADSISDFIGSALPQFKSEEVTKEQNNSEEPQGFSEQIMDMASDFINEQKAKLMEGINNNAVAMVSQFLDSTFSELSQDTLKSALEFLKSQNIDKIQKEYFESF